MRHTRINKEPFTRFQAQYIHDISKDDADIIPVLLNQHQDEPLVQRTRFRGHSLGLSLQTGNDSRQSILVDLEYTKETTHEAPEPFSTFRLAPLEPAFRHKRYDRLKRRACLEVS